MKWTEIASALWLPARACFDLTLAERRFLLGLLLLFCLGLGARWVHQRAVPPGPYSPPTETPSP